MTQKNTDNEVEKRPSEPFVDLFGDYYPGPLVISVILTAIVILLTAPRLDLSSQLQSLSTGFYSLLVLQVAFIFWWLLSPVAVENRRIGVFLDWICDSLYSRMRRTQGTIIAVTAMIAMMLGWVNWALGIIGGIYIGQKLARRAEEDGVSVHYPSVLMAGICSLLLANQGLTSPGGLIMSDRLLALGEIPGDMYPGGAGIGSAEAEQITAVENYDGFLELIGLESVIGFYSFLFNSSNLFASLLLLGSVPVVLAWLAPEDDVVSISDSGDLVLTGDIRDAFKRYTPPPKEEWSFADLAENNRWLSYSTGIIGGVYVAWYLLSGYEPSMTWMLFTLIMVGLVLHGLPQSFVERSTNSSSWAIPIGLPFIFYAAVVMLLVGSGVNGSIAALLDASGFSGLLGYIYSFVVGLFIPDPGSVWLIVAPSITGAGFDVVSSLVLVMFAAGISNLWLGFLFIGLITRKITGFSWREFTWYCTVISVYSSIVVLVSVYVF